jgi:hypothetical protein
VQDRLGPNTTRIFYRHAERIEFSGERKRVRCNEVLAAVAGVPTEEP